LVLYTSCCIKYNTAFLALNCLKIVAVAEGKWEDTGNTGLEALTSTTATASAAATALLAGELCRRSTALRRTLYKMPGLIDQRQAFLEMIKYV
jgi:hypothetical protein